MTITQLLTEIGDDNIKFNFARCLAGDIKQKKGHVEAKIRNAACGASDLKGNVQ